MKKIIISIILFVSTALYSKVDPIIYTAGIKFYLNDVDIELKIYDKIALEIGGSYYPHLYTYLSDDPSDSSGYRIHTALNLYSFEGLGDGWFLKPFYDYYKILDKNKKFYRYGLGLGYNAMFFDHYSITADVGYGIYFGEYINYLNDNNYNFNYLNVSGNLRFGFAF